MEQENKTFALVIQMSRRNELTGHSTLYCLGVELTKSKALSEARKSELSKKGYFVETFEAESLSDLK